ncbi:MAG: TIGR03617 family F420-dependent LLM class oxidoreductase [Actinobacteria bacterium]|nr:TIGR03617 family F420-dependent LLM class oxidoreductase [Actinomycetota bacterium]
MDFDVVSPGVPLRAAADLAREAQDLGFSGLWFPEAGRTAYLGCAAAATVAEDLDIGTAIAVAFPRSPMVTAQVAWELADATGGRFLLGLGTQVKAHNERRFSVRPFEHPGPRMRDYVLALRAIWRAFQGEEPLAFDGEFYAFDLLPPFFSPGPIQNPDVPVYVAGVNRWMARMAGEVCDGFHVHPFHSEQYLREVIRPAIEEGAALAGRDPSAVKLACPVFAIVGDTEEERAGLRQMVKTQIAFYGSTRTYRPVFEMHGWEDTTDRLREHQARGDFGAMAAEVTDEMLEVYAVEAGWDGIADAILDRYHGLVDRVFSYFAAGAWRASPEAAERWREVARRIRAA